MARRFEGARVGLAAPSVLRERLSAHPDVLER
jgi:hypothetical protein